VSQDTEVILFTGYGGLDSAIEALRLGAYDYLLKSELKLEELAAAVGRALERRRLALSNRALIRDLSLAREKLEQQRAEELALVRRLGETLAAPLDLEQLSQGLADLVWSSMPLAVLGIVVQEGPEAAALEAWRHREDLPPETLQGFKDWLKNYTPAQPLPAVLCQQLRAGSATALVAAGRQEPFSTAETEIFRIFAVQGETSLQNLVLFEEVKNLAIRDGLTGLYNYRHFWDLLGHQVELNRRYGCPLALLFLDLDNFKQINDTLGHSRGDMVLKLVASYLQSTVRQADVVCRYGGEEFVVILPQTSGDQAEVLAERLRCGLAGQEMCVGDRKIHLSTSIGVAGLKPEMDADALVNAADAALYRAKNEGKNKVCGPA
jgi:diguanylate cyclase (GGDEF)-like protein